ncbi:MAG: hypothetical protein JRG71_04520 [Deltaproteobacteria bacterium]|nr:hypothetical protein [Deltaproteobacteria bacterium]
MSKVQNVLKDHPEITLKTIEVTTNIKQTWSAGIRMFPALKIGDDILSGVLLSEDKIRTFVEQHVK